MKTKNIILFILKAIAAIIMLQTLTFKFSAAPESVYIFSKMGIEPWGRIGTGILEAIASVLLFVPRYTWLGALLGCGLMAGAVGSHLFVLGIEVMHDGGQLFIMGMITLICCAVLLFIFKNNIPIIGNKFKLRNANNEN